MSAKMATVGLLKIKVFWSKGYDVIIFVHNVKNQGVWHVIQIFFWSTLGNVYLCQFSLHESLYCRCGYVKHFGNSSISMRQVIITSVL